MKIFENKKCVWVTEFKNKYAKVEIKSYTVC